MTPRDFSMAISNEELESDDGAKIEAILGNLISRECTCGAGDKALVHQSNCSKTRGAGLGSKPGEKV